MSLRPNAKKLFPDDNYALTSSQLFKSSLAGLGANKNDVTIVFVCVLRSVEQKKSTSWLARSFRWAFSFFIVGWRGPWKGFSELIDDDFNILIDNSRV